MLRTRAPFGWRRRQGASPTRLGCAACGAGSCTRGSTRCCPRMRRRTALTAAVSWSRAARRCRKRWVSPASAGGPSSSKR
eukprot:scaffold26761_cov42-Phaeocystis_antarctica.AAC.3